MPKPSPILVMSKSQGYIDLSLVPLESIAQINGEIKPYMDADYNS
jgi:hypothetical protein